MNSTRRKEPAPNANPTKAMEAVMTSINREIWVVTSAARDRRGGLVATWVSEASIDRRHPVMVAGIAPNHFTAELIDKSGAFALHLLRGDQSDAAWNFCRDHGSARDKLSGFSSQVAESGSPLLDDCLAWLDCRVFARVVTGDRIYYWADVLNGERRGEGAPLREQDFIQAVSPEQRDILGRRRDADIQVQHPKWLDWRGNLPSAHQPTSPEPSSDR